MQLQASDIETDTQKTMYLSECQRLKTCLSVHPLIKDARNGEAESKLNNVNPSGRLAS